jgi:stage II sporulation protein D
MLVTTAHAFRRQGHRHDPRPARSRGRPVASSGALLLFVCVLTLILGPVPAGAASLDEFVFQGRGYGHGVGMSQWGAWAAARDGRSYEEILAFYYPGAALDPQANVELKVKLSSEPARALADLTQDFTQIDLDSRVTGADLRAGDLAGDDQTVRLLVPLAPGAQVSLFAREGAIELSVAGGPRQGPFAWVELRPQQGGRVGTQFRSGTALYPQTEYRGKVRAQPSATSGRLNAYNLVLLEDYVQAIAEVEYDWADEASSRYAPEAVKAQAVAARTYAVANMSPYLEDNQRDQVYRGYTFEAGRPGIAAAARATSGRVLRYQGRVISAFFSASSGGYTSMWSSGAQPYLPLQPDPWSLQAPPGNPGFGWTMTVSREELSSKVAGLRDVTGRPIDIGKVNRVEIAARETDDPGSHVASLRLVGTEGTALVSPAELRRPFGYSRLRSTLITEVVNPGFGDVPGGHYYYSPIMRVAFAGLVNGYPDGSFRPEASVSRWQFAKMVVNLRNAVHPEDQIPVPDTPVAPFADVPLNLGVVGDESDWVAAAKSAGLVRGVTETEFRPYDPVRRDQLASMIVRALGWEGAAATLPGTTPGFTDVAVGSTHWGAATYLFSRQVLRGYADPSESGAFALRPGEATSRMHVAVILDRILDLE